MRKTAVNKRLAVFTFMLPAFLNANAVPISESAEQATVQNFPPIRGEAGGRAMVPADLLPIRSYGGMVISPDRHLVAVEINRWDARLSRAVVDHHRTELWMTSLAGGQPKLITPKDPVGLKQWGATWSPDGQHLAFLSNEGQDKAFLKVWDRPTGLVKQLTGNSIDVDVSISRGHAPGEGKTIFWLDNRHLLLLMLPANLGPRSLEEDSTSPELAIAGYRTAMAGTVPTAVVASSPPDPKVSASIPMARLVSIDIVTGASRTVGEIPSWQPRIGQRSIVLSPDQKWAVIVAAIPPGLHDAKEQWSPRQMEWGQLGIASLIEFPLGIRWIDNLHPAFINGGFGVALNWQEKDATFAVLGQEPGGNQPLYIAQVELVAAKAHKIATLNENALRMEGLPVDINRLSWLKNGGVAVSTRLKNPPRFIEPEKLKQWWVVKGDSASLLASKDEIVDFSTPSQMVSPVHLQTSETARLYETDSAGHEKTLIPELNPQLKEIEEPRFINFQYQAIGGEQEYAHLLLPYGYEAGKKYPTVVWVYGGDIQSKNSEPAHRDDNSMFNLMLLAGHGYAVLIPSMPLPEQGIPGDPMFHLNDGVDPAIDRTIALGVADPDRLAVMGHSFGGYSTFGLLTQTQRYRAGIGMMGESDLTMDYLEFDARFRYDYPDYAAGIGPFGEEWAQGGMGVPPWEDPQRYLRNSPVLFADKIATPLLIVAGDLDFYPTQSEAMYTALNRQGKRAEFVRYLGEGHVLGSPANVLDLWQRIFAWLDTYVKNAETGTP